VSNLPWRVARRKGINPLDDGILYVAKFHADGTGEWLPLTPDNPALAGWPLNDILRAGKSAADQFGQPDSSGHKEGALHDPDRPLRHGRGRWWSLDAPQCEQNRGRCDKRDDGYRQHGCPLPQSSPFAVAHETAGAMTGGRNSAAIPAAADSATAPHNDAATPACW
jgi:hypothetical protein